MNEALPPIARYKIGYHADEWGQRSSTPGGIPDHAGSWVRYADHVAALVEAQQPAPSADALLRAAQPATGPTWAALNHAWHKIGCDAAGMDWGAFTNAVHYAPSPQAAQQAPVQSGLVATMLDALRHAQKVLNHNNLHLKCGPVNTAILTARTPADSAEPVRTWCGGCSLENCGGCHIPSNAAAPAQAPSQPGGFSAGDMASAAAQGYRQGYEQRDAEVRGALV